MKWFERLFNFYLDASIHVSFAVLSLLYITALFFNISIDTHLAIFIFFCTLASYNFIKYGVEAEKYILVSGSYHRYIQFFSFVAVGIAAYHANFLSLDVWLSLGVLALLVGLYALPVIPKAKNLRNLGILKIALVAFVWGGTTVILPLIATGSTFISWDMQIEALQRFILVFILMIPFEIRDLAHDDPNLKTVPQRIGVGRTKVLGVLGSGLFFFLTYLKDHISRVESLSKALLFVILILLIFVTRKNQSKYFASFWVEAIPLVWLGIALIANSYF